ncbi:helix-turn-helix domain-containing protein [Anaerotruncus rubiinfantis]|uniref:helix-turn-helix domain-containing protein n=1 Tax=Anaerotruncus rubiinfantis TaxID=1720200 RepID=UPI0011CC4A78
MNDLPLLLRRAQTGDNRAIEQLLFIYKPLIDRNSYVHGRFDEDLRQFILLRFLVAIKVFPFS